MYYTDDSLFPEKMQPLIITVAPYGPQWLPGDADIPITWDEQVQKAEATPACDKIRAMGQWNRAGDPFYELDPVWTDQFMATGVGIYASGVMPPKLVEFLSIAFDASFTHMYAPGTRRHIKAALKLGATMEEIMEVLKVCVAQGVQACNLGVAILAEELSNRGAQEYPAVFIITAKPILKRSLFDFRCRSTALHARRSDN